MGIVRTAEWKLKVPPGTARDVLRQAVESLDMEPSPDSGDVIRASAKRSLRRNRWASEITIEVAPLGEASMATCSVDMAGDKHYAVMSEIVEAAGDDMFDDRGANEAIERLGKASRLFGRKEVRHLEHLLHARERVIALGQGQVDDKQAIIALTTERLFWFEKSLGSETQSEMQLRSITAMDVGKKMTGETLTVHAGSVNREIKRMMHGQADDVARRFRNLLTERQSEAAAPAPAGSPQSDEDPVATIERLGKLRDAGLLAPEEFEAKKAELLKRI